MDIITKLFSIEWYLDLWYKAVILLGLEQEGSRFGENLSKMSITKELNLVGEEWSRWQIVGKI